MNKNYYIVKDGVVDNIAVWNKEIDPEWSPFEGAVMIDTDDVPLLTEVTILSGEEIETSRPVGIGENLVI